MNRVYNFSAGPSCLPEPVLKEAAAEMLDYNGTGQSVMEMSHRSKAYEPIIEKTEALVRKLMNVPENYKVLFLQGGASTQFAMIPMNLKKLGKAAYVDTGVWADKAIKEAKKYLTVDVLASSKDKGYSYIPAVKKIEGEYDYAYITLNNTIVGTKWHELPECGTRADGKRIPLVADASSCILSEPVDISKFGIFYAGAQKNLAPAGVTLVIIREDLIPDEPIPGTPTMLSYKIHADNGSMYNTPPCYTIYVMGKVLAWIEANGGAEGMKKRNQEKAALFYDYLDTSSFYRSPVEKGSRSLMNIPFVTRETDPDKAGALNKKFVAEAAAAGLVNLAGHRLVGGMRASIYNAMPIEGVKALIAFMNTFAKENA
ncbi:3-phosphoserine/phosphohydroxythreonine transaminase [Treponema brennaborense]|uniref:Phosphoserine aminotransferase n=1 Tax=Treponema brennaborense (strain DSM 12168 / CIP 105900 / DD5/3) TaxID=906968 RepID=F4LL53_TREBD|nr:3-phosphoserine/phosphohydroxythreonine transaminase [Treponema brennaborense]AEE17627.1 Phosphoserine aminotransferase [Treponema brennaborense DSM 12168]